MNELGNSSGAQWAARSAAVAILAFITLVAISLLFETHTAGTVNDIIEIVRLIIGLVFTLSGVAALALSARSLISGEHSGLLWAAFVIGLLATLLMVGEFTVLE